MRYRLDIQCATNRYGYGYEYQPMFYRWWDAAWLQGMWICWTEDHAIGFRITATKT
jgi:hypothetical protein